MTEKTYVAKNGKISQAKIIALLREHIGETLTSTQLRDILGLKNRTQTRGIMDTLSKNNTIPIAIDIRKRKISDKGEIYTYTISERPSGEVSAETKAKELEEVSFGLERDLEEYISRNLNQLEEGLRLYSAEGLKGRQYNTDVGRIDILALGKEDNFVVIELKVGLATDHVVGQILGYMRYIRQNLAKGKDVKGFIIADDFNERLKYAIAELPNIKLKKYVVKFEFQNIS